MPESWGKTTEPTGTTRATKHYVAFCFFLMHDTQDGECFQVVLSEIALSGSHLFLPSHLATPAENSVNASSCLGQSPDVQVHYNTTSHLHVLYSIVPIFVRHSRPHPAQKPHCRPASACANAFIARPRMLDDDFRRSHWLSSVGFLISSCSFAFT